MFADAEVLFKIMKNVAPVDSKSKELSSDMVKKSSDSKVTTYSNKCCSCSHCLLNTCKVLELSQQVLSMYDEKEVMEVVMNSRRELRK